MYCGVDENTRQQNCAIKPASTAGYAMCVELRITRLALPIYSK